MWRLATCLFVVSVATAGAAGDVPLRIVTFNTYQGIANAPADRDACGNLLTSIDLDGEGPNTSLMPDIVCLQETTSLDDLEAFRDDYLPGYHVIKGPTTDGFYSNAYFFRGDLIELQFREFSTPGPRPVLRLILDVPATPEHLVVYNAHFKAGQDEYDLLIRAQEANAIANRIAVDREFGIDLDNNGVADLFPRYYFCAGDLNQDDFSGTIIDPLLAGGSNGLPTALNDMRVETLFGAQVGGFLGDTWSTRGSLYRRYDYVLASDELFAQFDTNQDDTVDQDELNAAGFVYISTDDGGQQASGQVNASSVASDHASVIVDFTLPGIPGDLDGDGDVDLTDLSALLANYGMPSGAGPGDGDIDGDGDVDLLDLSALLANYGIGP
jgi:endonuclease/exonuclease/phosphatase family metal-dependent hydrolase